MRAFYIWRHLADADGSMHWVSGLGVVKIPDLIKTRMAILDIAPSEMFVPGIGSHTGYTYNIHCSDEEIAALAEQEFTPYWRDLSSTEEAAYEDEV
jgi:hypothetical protein